MLGLRSRDSILISLFYFTYPACLAFTVKDKGNARLAYGYIIVKDCV